MDLQEKRSLVEVMEGKNPSTKRGPHKLKKKGYLYELNGNLQVNMNNLKKNGHVETARILKLIDKGKFDEEIALNILNYKYLEDK